jgi:hypothetical protein
LFDEVFVASLSATALGGTLAMMMDLLRGRIAARAVDARAALVTFGHQKKGFP